MIERRHDFTNGLQIGDWTLDQWTQECVRKVENGEPFACISSGRCKVVALQFENEIDVTVVRDGYERITYRAS
jgi:hypothetical protein